MALAVPAAPVLADGAASTRNIIFGAAAATYLIIQHNRKVHEKYAEDARRQAALQSENNQAWAAYSSEKNAYDNSLAEITDLKREVAYQHDIIVQQRHELAMIEGRRAPQAQQQSAFRQSVPPPRRVVTASRNTKRAKASSNDVAMVSYGWGDL